MLQIEDVYKWLVRMYAYKYRDNPLNRLNLDLVKLQNEGKSRERAVLELALQFGMRLSEIEKLTEEGRTREEAIIDFLKGKKLQLTEDDQEIQEIVKKVHEDKIHKPSISGVTKEKPAAEQGIWKVLAKYFVHGLSFSLIMTVLVFVWVFFLAVLIVMGSFIGLIIGLIVLLFIIGGLNSFLTETIWSIYTRTHWMSLLGHGFVLFIALIVAHIPTIIVGLMAPSIPVAIALFIVGAFIDGFVAKNVASFWEE